jgi:hypothetical protein
MRTGQGRASTYRFSIISIILLLIFTNCGLEYYSFLYPPSNANEPVEGNLTASFKNDSRNNADEFEGFELYYRLYNPAEYDSDVDGEEDFVTDADNIAETENIQAFQVLSSYKFKRVYSEIGVDDEPLISVPFGDRDSSFDVVIDFNDVSLIDIDTEPIVSWLGNEIVIRRAAESQGERKKFRPDNIDPTDEDVGGIFKYELLETELDIVFFAFSYGHDSNLRKFYSKPVFLGNFRIVLFD